MKHPRIEQLELILRVHWWRGLMGILILLLLIQVYSCVTTLLDFRRIDSLIAQAEDLNTTPNKTEDNAQRQSQNQPPKQPAKNIFKKEDVQYQLTAILMDYAIINGQNAKVGDKVGKAEVKEIAMDHVIIQEDDKDQPTTLMMFQTQGGSGGRPGMRPPQNRPPRPPGNNRPPSAANANAPQPDQPGGQPPVMMGGMGGRSPGMAIRVEEIRNMSPDQRRAMRDQIRQQRGR